MLRKYPAFKIYFLCQANRQTMTTSIVHCQSCVAALLLLFVSFCRLCDKFRPSRLSLNDPVSAFAQTRRY